MDWFFFPLLILPFLLDSAIPTVARCPKICTCSLKFRRKIVICSRGGLTMIPTPDIDLNTHVIVVTAPPDNPNNVTLGRIFLKFTNLEELSITHSNVPAIGDSSFWPGRRLRVLNLSHNAIRFLRESDFNGLKNLRELDLSDNQISASPSAPFRYLTSLTTLLLARNRLQTLVPRFFYLLTHLEVLDLSGNALGEIDPENLQDVSKLKILKLSNCQLTRLHSLLYQQLPLLEELDLRYNLISVLAPEEFRHLRSLRILHLDGNMLSMILEDTFHGHSLERLGMSKNDLSTFSTCAFCNATVNVLDLSHNNLEIFNDEAFLPLSDSLEVLNISFNSLTANAFVPMLQPLSSLKVLLASNLQIDDLPSNTFSFNPELQVLNLSHNQIYDLSTGLLDPVVNLEILDLSHNDLPIINSSILERMSNLTLLRILHLHGNPFSCSECEIEEMISWLNVSGLYNGSCDDAGCLQCDNPEEMAGRLIHTVTQADLDMCYIPITSSRSLMYTSRAGLIVAVSVIIVLIIVIVIIIIVYKRHVAHYYTHEDNRPTSQGMYDNPALAGTNGGYNDDKPSFVSAAERVDDITDINQPSNSVG